MKKYLIIASFLLAFTLLPNGAEGAAKISKEKVFPAKTVIDTHAQIVQNSSTTGLYVISFSLTAFGTDVFVPAHAERMKTGTTTGKAGVEFGIYDGDENLTKKGLVASLLYSTSTKENGAYIIEENTSATFTLIAIYDNKGGTEDVYHARVKGVRYMLDTFDGQDILEIYGLTKQKTKEIQLGG